MLITNIATREHRCKPPRSDPRWSGPSSGRLNVVAKYRRLVPQQLPTPGAGVLSWRVAGGLHHPLPITTTSVPWQIHCSNDWGHSSENCGLYAIKSALKHRPVSLRRARIPYRYGGGVGGRLAAQVRDHGKRPICLANNATQPRGTKNPPGASRGFPEAVKPQRARGNGPE